MTLLLGSVLAALLAFSACRDRQPAPPTAMPTVPAAVPLAPDPESSDQVIRALEERVKRDGEDFVALNKLSSYYLARVREFGDLRYVDLASRAATASLAVLPAEENPGALLALAQVKFTNHDFAGARAGAQQLIQLDPTKPQAYYLLADSLLELGEYEQAGAIIQSLEKRSQGYSTEVRLARWAFLKGDLDLAKHHMANAIVYAQNQTTPSRESLAWSRWQLGDIHFSAGEYVAAKKSYQDALMTFPDYHRALSSLARVCAAMDDLEGAIAYAERAVRILPEPSYLAALGDLYKLAGRGREADSQYALLEQLSTLNQVKGEVYSRQIAVFYADHDRNVEAGFRQAKAEYQARRDIYGADALAWTALKANQLAEAQAAIREALRLGTRDAMIFYHAGMIARAAGETPAAVRYLQRALALSPRFDPLQADIASQTLEAISR